ncbi:META domain-containing protein [Sphingomonas sp. RS2018]
MKIVVTALLALVATAPATARTEVAPYSALGTEPFWSLSIDETRMTWRGIEGRPLSVRKPRPITARGVERYVARGMTVEVTHRACSDGMSDRRYADTVRVTIGRRVYDGCGGTLIGAQGTPLADTRWTLDLIDGRPVRLDQQATIAFSADRISGRICNGFGGNYRLARGTLIAGPIMATKMACPGAAGAVEAKVLALLAKPLSVSRGPKAIVLSDGARSLTLRPVR